MRILTQARLRLRSLFRRAAADRELDAELEFHLDQLTEENLAQGMPPEEARRAARRMLGSPTRLGEECRQMRRVRPIEDLARDVRYSLRSLARSPGFTAVAVATLGLGMGATLAIFSIADGVLLRPLEYPHPEQLMTLEAAAAPDSAGGGALSAAEYREFLERNRSFMSAGAYAAPAAGYSTGEVNLTAGDRPLRVRSAAVDAALLRTLGVTPVAGRLFTEEETSRWTGTLPPPLALLSYELWQSAYGGRPMVGRKVEIDGRPHEVAGILAPATDLMDHRTQVWLPLWLHPEVARQRDLHTLQVVARRREGVSAGAAAAELATLVASWGPPGERHSPTARPTRPADHTLRLRPMEEALIGGARRTIWVLQAAAAGVLLVVCANLANLVMARAGGRRREWAVRASLGAGGGRLLRQALTEGAVLAGLGALLGLAVAAAGLPALVRLYGDGLPRAGGLRIDERTWAVAAAAALGTALLLGLLTRGRAGAGSLAGALKDGARGSRRGGRGLVRRGLVVAQIALAVVLVMSAGLLAETVRHLNEADAGYLRAGRVTFSLTMPMVSSDPDTRARAFRRILDGLRAIPGVEEAAAMSALPMEPRAGEKETPVENFTGEDGRPVVGVDDVQLVMGEYFRTMGIPMAEGRAFVAADGVAAPRVAVVNETLARRLGRGRSAIGLRLRPAGGNGWHTVIGVARDVRQHGVAEAPGPEVYLSMDQLEAAPPSLEVVLRTRLGAGAVAGAIERAVGAVDPAVPVVGLREMEEVFAASIRRPRLLAELLGAFAALALALAAMGTYGVLSYAVSERRREIGIRMALGAARTRVLRGVLGEGMALAGAGVVAGLAGAAGVSRLLGSLLYGVAPGDAGTMAMAAVAMAAVAAAASGGPAWRASRVDPSRVMREE